MLMLFISYLFFLVLGDLSWCSWFLDPSFDRCFDRSSERAITRSIDRTDPRARPIVDKIFDRCRTDGHWGWLDAFLFPCLGLCRYMCLAIRLWTLFYHSFFHTTPERMEVVQVKLSEPIISLVWYWERMIWATRASTRKGFEAVFCI